MKQMEEGKMMFTFPPLFKTISLWGSQLVTSVSSHQHDHLSKIFQSDVREVP